MLVVGYYNSFAQRKEMAGLNLSALTHINYAFLIPRDNGTVHFVDEDDVKKCVNLAKSKGIKVFVSVGGWCDEDRKRLREVFEQICDNRGVLDFFIDNVIKVVKKYGFDGVDVDWEFPTIERVSNFEYLISSLSKKLKELKKELSIAIFYAVAGSKNCEWIGAISDDVISNLDFLNIMTYDCKEEENHSSIELAKRCVNYWNKVRKVTPDKLLIGIPFYSRPSALCYWELVDISKENSFLDSYEKETYNGINKVKEKILYTKQNCGGVIIWAINYDTTDQYSLLSAIASVR